MPQGSSVSIWKCARFYTRALPMTLLLAALPLVSLHLLQYFGQQPERSGLTGEITFPWEYGGKLVVNVKRGKLDGVTKLFDGSGNLTELAYYRDGRLQRTVYVSAQGNVTVVAPHRASPATPAAPLHRPTPAEPAASDDQGRVKKDTNEPTPPTPDQKPKGEKDETK
jgi:hypothetical protein